MGVLAIFGLFLVATSALSFPDKDVPSVEPEYLDMLLATNQHELFSKLMKIDDVDLVREKEDERSLNPMLSKGLKTGDILLTKEQKEQEEQARQGIRFDKYRGSQWPNQMVPYAISNRYSRSQRQIIEDGINTWNNQVECVKFVPRKSERNYVMFFSGNGCYSNLGRVGGQQPISLQSRGCLYESTVLHEMDHAIGFAHEQNRSDRDDYLEMLWENIPEEWRDQYEKTDARDFGLQATYDYYSIMHYPVNAPGTNKPAFRVKQDGIDNRKIGNGDGFTQTDLQKIREQYC